MELLLSKTHCGSGQEIYRRLFDNIQSVIKGQDSAIRKLLAAFFSGGHVLLEDYPGSQSLGPIRQYWF
jgi:MoxR-like ATPase